MKYSSCAFTSTADSLLSVDYEALVQCDKKILEFCEQESENPSAIF